MRTEQEIVMQRIDANASCDDPLIHKYMVKAQALLQPLLTSLSNVPQDDCQRFLLAARFDVNEAARMIRANHLWRKRYLPIQLTSAAQAELQKGKVVLTDCRDLEHGCPIIVVHSSKYDPLERNLLTSVQVTVHVLEQALARSKKLCLFYNRNGFQYDKNWDFEYIKSVITLLRANYPETLASVHVYPTGSVLPMLWPLVSAMLDPRTVPKVKMHNTYEEAATALPKAVLDAQSTQR